MYSFGGWPTQNVGENQGLSMQAHAHAAVFQPIAIRADLMERDQVVLMEFCLLFFLRLLQEWSRNAKQTRQDFPERKLSDCKSIMNDANSVADD